MRALDSMCTSFSGRGSGQPGDGARPCGARQLRPVALSARAAERLQLGLENGLLAFEAAEFDQQGVALGACCASDMLAQARQIALHRLQFRLDRAAIEV